jgi:5S rRNA maturation endonuclease (ribonuclease M5)
MYDHERNITGVRLRYISGEKKSIRGSKDGVFLPYFDFVDPILVTEGPTDASALTVLGFTTVGRPSCLGGTEIIAKIAHNRDVVIVSDRDEPGRRGAVALASRLVPISKGIKIIEPVGEANDAREWVNKGATNEVIQMVIDSAVDYRKTAQRDVVKNRS